jgi:hypothetical protein
MLSAILSSVGGAFFDKLFGNMRGAFEAYLNKQISLEELRSRMVIAAIGAAKEVEVSHADALAKTYASFMDAMKQSKLMQVMWACTVGSQLFVLVWHQLAIPFIAFAFDVRYPSSGETVNWAYILLAACLGMGPIVMRSGPGAGSVADKLKAMVSK